MSTTYALGCDALRWMLILLCATVVGGVAAASDEAQESEAEPEVMTLGPNDVPNFRSTHYMSPPLLEPGLDFTRVPLTSAHRDAFPSGRQFVLVRAFTPRRQGDGGLLLNLDLDRYRHLQPDGTNHFHVVLTKPSPNPRTLQYNDSDFTIEELWGAPDTGPLEGPWTVWVDDRNVLTQMTTAGISLEESFVSVPTRPHFVCVDDGLVLGSVGDHPPSLDEARLTELYDACLDGSWGSDWSPIQYGSGGVVPTFLLSDHNGGELRSEELAGAPYAILVQAPESQPNIEFVPGRDASILRAIEPEPAVRLEQVRSLLTEAVPDIRIIVLAVPYHDGERLWGADEVAAALSDQLDAPVYLDASGHLVNALAQYLGPPTSLVVVDAQGRLIDTFSDRMLGEAGVDWWQPPSLEDVLRRTIGWGPE